MTAVIIDRRKNDRNKSISNRNKFLQRSKQVIKRQVDQIIQDRNLKDAGKGDKITIPKKDITEPNFNHGKGGDHDYVLPGNKDKVVGDTIPKPKGGIGQGGKKGSPDGESEDDFTFDLSREEFLDFFFEDLELPDLIKTQLKETVNYKNARAGFTTVGSPNNLNIIRSMRNAKGRQIALRAPFEKKIKEIEELLEKETDDSKIAELKKKLEGLKKQALAVPFIDDFDLRYNSFEKRPEPTSKAVMFCLLDVSGSMGSFEKDLAKRFFVLLYLFLERKYEKIDVIFVRHHTNAREVDEKEFFHARDSGGTIVSSGLELIADIIRDRYPTSDWNIYISQASDGDNWNDDGNKCMQIIQERMMPYIQYFAYVQVAHEGYDFEDDDSELWPIYLKLTSQFKNFNIKRLAGPKDIYPVFRELFSKSS